MSSMLAQLCDDTEKVKKKGCISVFVMLVEWKRKNMLDVHRIKLSADDFVSSKQVV